MEKETALSILGNLISKTQNMSQAEFDVIDSKVNYSYDDSKSFSCEDIEFGELSFEEVCIDSIQYDSVGTNTESYTHSNPDLDSDLYLLAA